MIPPTTSTDPRLSSWIHITDYNELDHETPIHPYAPPYAISQKMLETPDENKKSDNGSHVVVKIRILGGPDKGKLVHFKKCDSNYPSILAQIESAMSTSYRIVRLEKAALVRPVVDDRGVVVGSISYDIKGFRPMAERRFTVKELIEMGAAYSLIARLVRKENDDHPYNRGITEDENGEKKIVDIDFDMSLYKRISEIKGLRYVYYVLTPQDTFTKEDLLNCPVYKDFNPCYSPALNPQNGNLTKQDPSRDSYIQLPHDQEFVNQKWDACLLELLIDPETHFKLLEGNYSKDREGEEELRRNTKDLRIIYEEFEEVLINLPEFRNFLSTNHTILDKCINHFMEYNQKIARNHLIFNLDLIKNRYEMILKKCMIKDLTQTLYHIGATLYSHREKKEHFRRHYNALINICINFQEHPQSMNVNQSFFWLETQLKNHKTKVNNEDWNRLTRDFTSVFKNYQETLLNKAIHPVRSVPLLPALRRKNSDRMSRSGESNIIIPITVKLKKWLSTPINKERILGIVRECLEIYQPSEFCSFLNPYSYCRNRKSHFDCLIQQIEEVEEAAIEAGFIARYIANFTRKGEWNLTSYISASSANVLLINKLCSTASANVLLINKLCSTALESFRSNISLEGLKEFDLVEFCLGLQEGHINLEERTREIASHLDQNSPV